ncbi:MAG: glycosyltransferase family 2 protein, partial [Anaerolineae bacterium]|nr:glycosyltransferase family 2 protein [Anaerolineae bacterium]
MQIDLILLADQTERLPAWPLGSVHRVAPQPSAVSHGVERYLRQAGSSFCLFWDANLGQPETESVAQITRLPGDVWHAGLRLGMGGMPGLIDFVSPTWLYNRDPEPAIEATSWRLSLQATLVRTEVLNQMGGPRPEFQTLTGAALELGHRWIKRGVLPRHIPRLITGGVEPSQHNLPFEDELRFVYYRFGRYWSRWALGRAILSGYVSAGEAIRGWRQVVQTAWLVEPAPFVHPTVSVKRASEPARVTVLIPTLERYSYLRTLLNQLRLQTVKPFEIIIVDQSPPAARDTRLAADFADLPLKIICRNQPGQCSSRNAGLSAARGDYILFIDDDDEVSPNLIEAHLETMGRFQAPVSSGVADEVGAGPLPQEVTYVRASSVFPTNNTLISRDLLRKSGLFDLAYDRGSRADGDL